MSVLQNNCSSAPLNAKVSDFTGKNAVFRMPSEEDSEQVKDQQLDQVVSGQFGKAL